MTEGRIFVDINMSVAGFIAGPNDGPENPLGDGSERVHEWVYRLASWREPQGVAIGGGANTIQQALNAGLLDEVQLHIAPNTAGGWGPVVRQGRTA